ncbi:hypothetical protein SYK_27320 [Pseudodesulfovibrio nedwellii]|uniref:Peptidoglycan binding-like domain-containing protein n=1 Tax=Pseudodesulfovibrio nedwellii TaxID=2973072 RepID=A0ABM8B3I4_9BACT|nr:peptidoglycan-binding protein [Pseudodesulfovibrio nedwellii]BDQ38372.1 hypothetical protein SYK_27320 [Pseudodesulfovibrio nedwellii]
MKKIILTLSFLICLTTASPVMGQDVEWPPDALAVSYAVAAKLTNQQGPSSVSFAPGADAYMEGLNNGYFYNFKHGGAIPVIGQNYGIGDNYAADVAGVIHLFDSNERIATLQYLAQYTVQKDKISITQCLAATSSPSKMTLEVYMIPYETFLQAVPIESRGDWGAVYHAAKTYGFNPQRDQAKIDKYLVMTFVKNRLPADAKFEVIMSDRKKAQWQRDNLAKKQESYLDYDGWRVHMFAAKFNPSSLRDRFYNNYYYTPGSGIAQDLRERNHVARYNSKPSASGPSAPIKSAVAPPVPTSTPRPQTAYAPTPTPQTGSGEGPYGRGTAFLNPVFPEDVKAMQVRLRDLGYYKGKIDQNWGPITRQALDNFAVKYGFPKGQWSLGLQKALFKGTGL